MHQTALLLLTGPIKHVTEFISHYLFCANKRVSQSLYVKLEPDLCRPFLKSDFRKISSVIPIVYFKAATICKNVDVRILLTNGSQERNGSPTKPFNFDVILTNSSDENVDSYVKNYLKSTSCNIIKLESVDTEHASHVKDLVDETPKFVAFKTVCLGGTFDRLHNGHKVLLTEGALRSDEKLIVGVSEGDMTKKKVLWELIEPIDKRIAAVSKFLLEVDPSLSYEVVAITDPYGPTITIPNIDCLVVTTETKVGGTKVNVERQKRGMAEVVLQIVELVENLDRSSEEEEKLSSSTQRIHLLGTPLHTLEPTSDKPYCILLRGHPSSGKDLIASRLHEEHVPLLCCDEILLSILRENEDLKEAILTKFMKETPTTHFEDGFMKKLLAVYLKQKELREWVENALLSKLKERLKKSIGHNVQTNNLIVIKESTLFEGCKLGIENQESWAVILPEHRSIRNMKEDLSLTDDEAAEALKLLPSNTQYVTLANIVFSCEFSELSIKEQMEKACLYLKSTHLSE